MKRLDLLQREVMRKTLTREIALHRKHKAEYEEKSFAFAVQADNLKTIIEQKENQLAELAVQP